MRSSTKQTLRSMLLGVVVFVALQQVTLYISPSSGPDCPQEAMKLSVKNREAQGPRPAITTSTPHKEHGKVKSANKPKPMRVQPKLEAREDDGDHTDHGVESRVNPDKDMATLHEAPSDNNPVNEAKRQTFFSDRLQYAGPGDCVSVREVAEYYCHKEDEEVGCAKATDDCDHLPGCVSCKAGSSIFWPGDNTNCLKCEPGYAFADSGFEDCTGVCKPDADATTAVATSANPWSFSKINRSLFNPISNKEAWDQCTYIDNVAERLDKLKALEQTYVVMVTTMGNASEVEKQQLQLAAATSWDVLAPGLLTLVAVDAENVSAPRGLPRIHCQGNAAGTPYVTNLFVAAEKAAVRVGARFAGFSNGDIAYDETLFFVLSKVSDAIEAGKVKKRVVVVGRRLNIDSALDNADDLIHAGDHVFSETDNADDTRQRRQHYRQALVKASKKRRNRWMTSLAEDFFFFTPGTFEWDEMPNFVIGRVGWDSFLTQLAIENPDIEVIDASKMIHAGHLTGDDGNAAGWNTQRPDKLWNYCALHHACLTNKMWTERCKTCFRCGLGSLEQSNLMMVPSGLSEAEMTSAKDYYAVQKRKPDLESEADTRKTSKQILKKFGVHSTFVDRFVDRVRDNTTSCRDTANCCSISGSAAVEYELGMRWQVRAEWPINGKYPHEK
eukprot:m.92984 g.92984  ORF g.92984 m.92984 type:complete len:668 (+) comp26590_c1_seq1:640-2643(+)